VANLIPRLSREEIDRDCSIPWNNRHSIVVNLDEDEIPPIKMTAIPEETFFVVFHKLMFISAPPFCEGEGNVGVHLNKEIEDPFEELEPNPFREFWMKTDSYVNGRDFNELGVPYVFLNIPGDTLDIAFEEAKKLIDEFWSKHLSILEELDKEMDYPSD
jgi:hypothetical protein